MTQLKTLSLYLYTRPTARFETSISYSLLVVDTQVFHRYLKITMLHMRSQVVNGSIIGNMLLLFAMSMPCSLKLPPQHSLERVALEHATSFSWLLFLCLVVGD